MACYIHSYNPQAPVLGSLSRTIITYLVRGQITPDKFFRLAIAELEAIAQTEGLTSKSFNSAELRYSEVSYYIEKTYVDIDAHEYDEMHERILEPDTKRRTEEIKLKKTESLQKVKQMKTSKVRRNSTKEPTKEFPK